METVDRTDHVRALALTCLVLAIAGMCSLVTVSPRHHTRVDARANRASLDAGIEIGGASGDPSVPPPTVPLFSAAPAPAVPKPTSTTSANAATIDDRGAANDAVHPAVGTFAYNVDGTEQATGFGTRKLPTAMTVAIKHDGASGFIADFALGPNHTEHEVWSASAELIGLRSETITAVFGPVTRSMVGTYDATVGRMVLPLKSSASRAGVSVAHDANGAVARTEDWTVTDVSAQPVTVGGTSVSAWQVTLLRTSRSGAAEPLNETRKAWFDPAHGVWVKWQTQLHTERGVSAYDLAYTATLTKLPN